MAVKTDLERRIAEAHATPVEQDELKPNRGVPLNLDWVEEVR